MKPKALIVEDDDRIIDSIGDVLFSIGHDHDWATNQHDAQQLLKAGDYSYVLLDLQIPAKPNRGGADKEFGANLLKDIQQIKGRCRLPVIVMTAHSADCLDLTTELFAGGAMEFIAKPFSNKGRTLASVIRKVLRDHDRKAAAAGVESVPPDERAFAGGELVLYPDRAELCGVRIITDRGAGQCMMILRQLCKKDGRGRFVRQSSEELANAIDAPGGASTIAGCIKRIRDNIAQRLKREMGIECGREDVIQNNWQGYAFREWIAVHEGGLLTIAPVCAKVGGR